MEEAGFAYRAACLRVIVSRRVTFAMDQGPTYSCSKGAQTTSRPLRWVSRRRSRLACSSTYRRSGRHCHTCSTHDATVKTSCFLPRIAAGPQCQTCVWRRCGCPRSTWRASGMLGGMRGRGRGVEREMRTGGRALCLKAQRRGESVLVIG